MKRKIELLVNSIFLLGLNQSVQSQSASNVILNASAKGSPCANIVAVAGARVDCDHLTKDQIRALAQIPAILRAALVSNEFLKAMSSKLEQLQEASGCPSNAGVILGGKAIISGNGGYGINSSAPICETSAGDVTVQGNTLGGINSSVPAFAITADRLCGCPPGPVHTMHLTVNDLECTNGGDEKTGAASCVALKGRCGERIDLTITGGVMKDGHSTAIVVGPCESLRLQGGTKIINNAGDGVRSLSGPSLPIPVLTPPQR